MARKNIEDTYPVILKCALIITGVTQEEFQAKDVIFQVDLVRSLFHSSNHHVDFNLQPLQIIRIFDAYQAKGWARNESRKKQKIFSLEPLGIFEIVQSLLVIDTIAPTSEIVFLQWFVDAYGEFIKARLSGMLTNEEWAEIERLTRSETLIQKQLRLIEESIRDVTFRIEQSNRLQSYIRVASQQNNVLDEIVANIPSEYSYRLSHRKRFRDFIKDLPRELKAFEIERGIELRQKNLYQRSLTLYNSTKSFYQALLGQSLSATSNS